VKLIRSLGRTHLARLDPFLMLDEFSSEDASDYIAGFPSHPHRGFETVTYMLNGHMLHQDHLGNRGDLRSGDVQWMTAARGIIHSEMPQQESGRMRGFQLWINLPAREKMKPASYRDIPSRDIPLAQLRGGATARVIAGTVQDTGGSTVTGPVTGISTDPTYLDIALPADAVLEQPIGAGHNCCVYVYEGELLLGPEGGNRTLHSRQLGVTGDGDRLQLRTGASRARCLLLAARPINEPIVQYGPFVMNTRAEIEQAILDYQTGALTQS
jgi:hypothetical protein